VNVEKEEEIKHNP